jgi:hypothetical protein
MMVHRQSDDAGHFEDGPGERGARPEERWRAIYDPEVAEMLHVNCRYSIVRLGSTEFAFSDYGLYVSALKLAWAAGFIPDHGPSSVPGADLPEVAPSLRGADVDITSHLSADLER